MSVQIATNEHEKVVNEGDGNMNNFNEMVLNLAHERDRAQKRNEIAKAMLDRFHAQFIAPYEAEIKANDDRVKALETEIRDQAEMFFRETGDRDIHSHLTVRVEDKWQYDKKAVLKQAIDAGAEFVRVKQELDVRKFEKALKSGLEGYDAETVKVVTVAISKLGDLVIAEEAKPHE